MPWLTPDDAAKQLQVCTRTVRRRVVDREVVFVRFGPRLVRVWLPGDEADVPSPVTRPDAAKLMNFTARQLRLVERRFGWRFPCSRARWRAWLTDFSDGPDV